MTPERADKLRAAFLPEEVGKLPRITCGDCSNSTSRACGKHQKSKCDVCGSWITSAHLHLDFVGHADITNRLLDVDPSWTWEPVPDPASLGLPIAPGGMWIRLTIGSVTRLGYGDAGTKKGHDAVKEAIGDALRNAAMRFGVALALWAKGDREWARQGGASLDATTQTQATPVDDRDAAQVEADTIREQILEWAKVNHRDPSTVAAAFAAEYNTPIQDAAANILEIFFQDRLIEAEQARVAS